MTGLFQVPTGAQRRGGLTIVSGRGSGTDGPSDVRVCLPPQRFSPGGLFKTSASASRCMFTHHYCPLSFPTAVSFLLRPLSKAAESRAGWRRREKRQCLVKREREKTALQRRQTARKHSSLCRRPMFDGFCVLTAKTLRQTGSKGRSFCRGAAQSLPLLVYILKDAISCVITSCAKCAFFLKMIYFFYVFAE